MTFERRIPGEPPIDPETTEELRAADDEAREDVVNRGAELLERLRKL